MVAKKILENQPNLFLIDQPTILFGQREKKGHRKSHISNM